MRADGRCPHEERRDDTVFAGERSSIRLPSQEPRYGSLLVSKKVESLLALDYCNIASSIWF